MVLLLMYRPALSTGTYLTIVAAMFLPKGALGGFPSVTKVSLDQESKSCTWVY
jgi:hypothetical protein